MAESVHHMPTRSSSKRRKTKNKANAKTTAATYVPLTQFTLFPSLPLELRLQIFGHSLPSTKIRHRMLRVSGDYTTEKPRVKNKGYIKFTLLDNVHSASVKDHRLLSACIESREVFVSKFRHSLHAGNGGLIRYTDEDVVYIANMPSLVHYTPILKTSRAHLLKELTMHNLALPAQMFLGEEFNWGHQCPIHQIPSYGTEMIADKYVPILYLKNLRVLAPVEWDFDTWGVALKERYLKGLKRSALKVAKAKLMKALFKSLPYVQAEWTKASQEGKKRPLLRIIDLEGNWDLLKPKKK